MAALRGAEYDSAESLAERVDRALDALAEPDVDLVYVYWSEIDHLGHGLGWRSEQWRAELAATDTQLARLAAGLPADTLLLVTADHGMVDVPARESEVFGGPSRYDVATRADLADGVALVAGEPRMVHLHCHPGRAHDVARTWAYVLGDRAVVRGRAEAIADWFAPVAPRFEAVIGDVVVAMLGDIAVHDSRTQSEGSLGLVGMHGSITPEETGIPLLALRS